MLFQNRYQQAVKFLCSLIPAKSSLKILGSIKVSQKKESITYEATDLDNFLRVRLPLWGDIEGDFVVDAKQLPKAPKMFATKIAKDKVHFGNLSLLAQEITEFPSLETGFFKKPVWEQPCFSRHEFLKIGKRACNYTAHNELHAVLEGVCFRDGSFYATNGQYLLKAKVGLKAKKGIEFIIPRTFFKLLSNDFVIDDAIDLSVFMADKDQGYIIARGMSFELVSKLLPGEYPIIENVLPKEMPHVFLIEREPFLEVVKKAVLYANKKSYMAEMFPLKDRKGLGVKVQNKETGVEFVESIVAKQISKKKWDGCAFNAKSMSVILADAPGGIVTFKAGKNKLSALTIEPDSDSGLFFLLMPLRTFEEDGQEPNPNPESTENKEQGKKAESKEPVPEKEQAPVKA